MVKVVRNVVCPFCGTLCDDLEILVEDNHIVGTRHACRIGNAKFMHFEGAVRYTEPLMRENKKDDFKKVDIILNEKYELRKRIENIDKELVNRILEDYLKIIYSERIFFIKSMNLNC